MATRTTDDWWARVQALPPVERDKVLVAIREAIGPLRIRYSPIHPTPQQEAFLRINTTEALYGGAAGGGKSAALLMGALQYVDVPGYAAILFRRSYTDLSLPGALMDMADGWLAGTEASWHQTEKTWEFPGGGSVTFAYMATDMDRLRYQSAEFQFVGFDEITQFTERQYRYLLSRVRRPKHRTGEAPDGMTLDRVPLRARCASNPGGPGHIWVKGRFVDAVTRAGGAVFVPARLEDNPYLDQVSYEAMLENLLPTERARLRWGDWEAKEEGRMFQREWFNLVDAAPSDAQRVRYWDCAATEEDPEAQTDPDWTVGLLLAWSPGSRRYTIEHVFADRLDPGGVEAAQHRIAMEDGPGVSIGEEMEPGSAGKTVIAAKKRGIFMGYSYEGFRPTGDKATRARPVASAAKPVQGDKHGLLDIVRGPWLSLTLDQIGAFPSDSEHDDVVDALSGAFEMLAPWTQGETSAAVAVGALPARPWQLDR